MPSVKELRDELRKMRKGGADKPISKMSKLDCAMEIERMKATRESTPPVASTLGAKKQKEYSTAPTLKKHQEHPLSVPSKGKDKAPKEESKMKTSKKDMLAMLAKMVESSSDEE
jgi:hypothetical protein